MHAGKVAFLGPEATFSHAAARAMFGRGAEFAGAADIAAVFEAVRTGDAAYGVVPIENSTEGPVSQATDLLLDGGVQICGELVLEIEHALLTESQDLAGITQVYSHPQALAQCRGFLMRELPGAEIIETPSTAMAARSVRGRSHSAAIASVLASEIYGVPALRKGIQDQRDNATRFVALSLRDAPPTGRDRTTVVFSTPNQPGALLSVLGLFAKSGINLSRIESRPSRRRRWDYAFLVDLDGHRCDATVALALEQVRGICEMMIVAGSYPKGSSDA